MPDFVMHDGIWKIFGTNSYHDKTMCQKQKLCGKVKGLGHSQHLNFVHRL